MKIEVVLVLVYPNPNNLIYIRFNIVFPKATQRLSHSAGGCLDPGEAGFVWSAGWRTRHTEGDSWPLWNSRSGQLSPLPSQLRSPSGANLAQKAAHIFAWIDPFTFNRSLCGDDGVLHIAHTKLQYGTGNLAL